MVDAYREPPKVNAYEETVDSPVLPLTEQQKTDLQLAAMADTVNSEAVEGNTSLDTFSQKSSELIGRATTEGYQSVVDQMAMESRQRLVQAGIDLQLDETELRSTLEFASTVGSENIIRSEGVEALRSTMAGGSDNERLALEIAPVELETFLLNEMEKEISMGTMSAQILDELQGQYTGGRAIVDGLADFVQAVLPLTGSESRIGNVDIGRPVSLGDHILPGQRQQDEINFIHATNDPEEFRRRLAQYYSGLLQDDKFLGMSQENQMLQIIRVLDAGKGIGVFGANVEAALDNLPLVGAAVGLARRATQGAYSLTRAARGVGSMTAANEIEGAALTAAKAGQSNKMGMSADQIIDNITPGALDGADDANKAAVAAQNADEVGRAAGREILGDAPLQTRTDPAERQRALDAAVDKARRELGNARVLDVRSGTEAGTLTEAPTLTVRVGNRDGGLFLNRDEAINEGLSLGWSQEAMSPVLHRSGQWSLDIKYPVLEDTFGIYNRLDAVPDVTGPFTGISRWILGTAQVLDKQLFGGALIADSLRNTIVSKMSNTIKEAYKGLSRNEKLGIRHALRQSQEQAHWMTRDEFFAFAGRSDPKIFKNPERSWAAYRAHRKVSDLEWTLRNEQRVRSLRAQAYETVSLSTDTAKFNRHNARVTVGVPLDEVWDLSSGVRMRMSSARYSKGDYVTIRFERPQSVFIGDAEVVVQVAVVKRSDLSRGPLDRFQYGYSPGGHRPYDPKVRKFVKQARDVDGRLGSPRTYFGARTEGELLDWVTKHNAALDIYNAGRIEGISEVEMLARLKPYTTQPSKFIDDIENGRIDPNHKFEIVDDRRLPSAYDGSPDWTEYIDDAIASDAHVHGRLYDSRKGDALRTPTGALVETVDPLDALQMSIGNISQLIGLGEYRARAMGRWLETYGEFAGEGRTMAEKFFNPNWQARISDPQALSQAKKAHQAIMRTMRTHSKQDELVHIGINRWLDTFDKGPRILRSTAQSLGAWKKSNNFLDILRRSSHAMFLGMFDIRQWPLQIQTSWIASSINPRVGLPAAFHYKIFKQYAQHPVKPSDASTLKVIGGLWKVIGFESATDMLDAMKALRSTGFTDFGNSHMMIGNLSPAESLASKTGLSSGIGKFVNAGNRFFNDAEHMNRITAWNIGWIETSKKYPNFINVDRTGFLERVRNRAETLSLNMSTPSRAAWQDNPTAGLAFQFRSYQNRMLELYFGEGLTNGEKLRMVAGQLVLYGPRAVPGTGEIEFAYRLMEADKAGDASPSMGTLSGIARRGAMDYVVWLATGNDLMVADRFSMNPMTQLLDDADTLLDPMFGGSTWIDQFSPTSTDKTIYEALMGPGGVILDRGSQIARKFYIDSMLVGALNSESEEKALETLVKAGSGVFLNTLRMTSSFSNMEKAIIALNTGELMSRRGMVLDTDISNVEAVATYFGVNPSDVYNAAIEFQLLRDESAGVDRAVKILGPAYQQMIEARGTENFTDRISQYRVIRRAIIGDDYELGERVDRLLTRRSEPTYEAVRERRQREIIERNLTEENQR